MSPREPPGPLSAGSVRHRRLLLPGLLQGRGEPVLRIFHLHHANRTQFAIGHHLARLPHHGMTGVVVGDCEQKAGAADGCCQIESVFESGGERLVADYVNASVEKRLRRRIVQMVRSDDRNDINPVFAGCLRRRHFSKTAVGSIRRDVEIQCSRPGLAPHSKTKRPRPAQNDRQAGPRCDALPR